MNCGNAGRGNDLAAWCGILSHKVDGQLDAVHDSLIVNIGTRRIGLRWYPGKDLG